jgi:membrane protein involved in colicin uptake
MSGRSAKQGAYAEADQLDAKAKQERAVGTYQQSRVQQRAAEIMAQQRNRMAANGGAADGSDGTSAAIIAETSRKASVEQLLIQAQAEDAAKQDEYQAVITRKAGKNAQRAANFEAAGSILKAGASIGGSWSKSFGGGKGSGVKAPSGGGTYGPPV